MASRRFVLPSPLSPNNAVSPDPSSSSTDEYDRKSVNQRLRSSTESGDRQETRTGMSR